MFVCFGHGILATHQELSALFRTVSQPKTEGRLFGSHRLFRDLGCCDHLQTSS